MFEFIDLKRFTDALISLRVTPNQLYMLFCLASGKGSVEILRFLGETGLRFERSEVEDLVDRGYIVSFSRGEDDISDFDVTDKFRAEFFTDDPMEAAEQFWEVYPSFFQIKERQAVTKSNVNKELLLQKYAEEIGYSKPLHTTVLAAIEWAKSNNMIMYKISDFVNVYWRDVVAAYQEAQRPPQQLTNETYYE